ncbi:DUF6152 family protein [Mesorhizobium sp. J428]|uniref:DUF6152 family protein n=1 Tax=Mesorhizobium sp. J428 TaxID=2898440 RepID=UPI002151743F|nr:DUF6152 family protein [Mesorhizobium sp. J428]MCR5857175.1 DUF6152 family protein [Mesorhizobium sp. J428]
MKKLVALAGTIMLMFSGSAAFAHHGWSWTQDGFFELTGRIVSIYYGNPHPVLDVEVDGQVWKVDLATPAATTRAGFLENTAKIGDDVTAVGNRSRDETRHWMKAVRISVGGKTYDVYPSRVPPAN